MRRVISLWLPAFATDRLSCGPAWRKRRVKPFVISVASAGGLCIAAVNLHAAEAGVQPGMPLADARALAPGLEVTAADPLGDAEQLAKLAAWCGSFSPWTAPESAGSGPDGAGIWLDATGCAHLFGGEEELLRELLERVQRLGFVARAALADTAGAAWAVARFGASPQDSARAQGGTDGARSILVPAGATAATLAPLPIAGLRLPGPVVEGLAVLGLRRIADLMTMPRAPLVARFGNIVTDRLDRALGSRNESISPLVPEIPHRERLGLAEPIGTRPAIEAALAHLLTDLCARLGREHKGVRRLDFALFRVDGHVAHVRIGTSRPVREPKHLARLFAEHLDALDLGEGIEVLTLTADSVEALAADQLEMPGPALDHALASAGVAELVDRLTNRLGPESVLRLVERPSHVPERAGVTVAAARREAEEPLTPPPGRGERPLRLFPQPFPIDAVAPVPDGPPVMFRWRRVLHRVARAEGPERIAPEWWRTSLSWTTPWEETTRDYYRIEDESGRRFWVYREGLYPLGYAPPLPPAETEEPAEAQSAAALPRWFVHGLFA
jgi:protein ImuB